MAVILKSIPKGHQERMWDFSQNSWLIVDVFDLLETDNIILVKSLDGIMLSIHFTLSQMNSTKGSSTNGTLQNKVIQSQFTMFLSALLVVVGSSCSRYCVRADASYMFRSGREGWFHWRTRSIWDGVGGLVTRVLPVGTSGSSSWCLAQRRQRIVVWHWSGIRGGGWLNTKIAIRSCSISCLRERR